MTLSIRNIFTALLLFMTTLAGAQTLTEKYELAGAYTNGNYAPMWHMSNRQGLGSERLKSLYTLAGINGKNIFSNKGITLDWGADLVISKNLSSAVFIQQAYLDISWKRFTLSLGQKERWGELKSHRLSTGALVESGNARPVPQIRIEVPEYWEIRGTNGWLAMRGHIAFGWFTDEYWQKDFAAPETRRTAGVRYHSKTGFVRLGNEKKFPLVFEAGLHMVSEFGGVSYYPRYGTKRKVKNPTRFKDYLMALLPTKGDDKYDAGDAANIAGNVLGSWLGRATWHGKDWKGKLYYEHLFDDHSQMFMEYGVWTEQLVGIEIEFKNFKWIKGIAVEYFNLKNQSGPIYHDSTEEIPDQVSCMDNNYNHGKYAGWFNYGFIMGTPLCTSPIYNKDKAQECYNNRVEAFHIGIEGELIEWLGYRLLLTHSNNWGTYRQPFKDIKTDTSGIIELTLRPKIIKNWSITGSFAFDKGDLYGDNNGVMLTIRRSFTHDFSKQKNK